jgi:hypothetical protein
MFSTFNYDRATGGMVIAGKVNSDFISHIALIRSFSLGDNFQRILELKLPEYPLFPGEPIRYHFVFYMLVGLLERIGVRIDWALNIPSILGFFLLLSTIFLLSKRLFNNYIISCLSVLFFFFNGSLSFIRFFKLNPISASSVNDIIRNSIFPSFAPWGPGEISAFWNLNIYTNQRHLGLAFGIILLFIIALLKLERCSWAKQKPWAVVWGLVIAVFPYFHQPSLIIFAILMLCYWLFFPSLRKLLFSTGIISLTLILPQIFGIRHGPSLINWAPGYLIPRGLLNPAHFTMYWWENLGYHSILIPLGFLLSSVRVKKIIFPIFLLFTVPNLVTFSPEAAANHKFFNFYLILGSMLTAYLIVFFYKNIIKVKNIGIRVVGGLCLIILTFSLMFSGIIDFFAVRNDGTSIWPDIKSQPLAHWFYLNTDPSSVVLTADYISPVSLSGRKIFIGWPYFSWSAGYDTNERINLKHKIFMSESVTEQCGLLRNNNLSYIVLAYPAEELDFTPNYNIFLDHGTPAFKTSYGIVEYTVYDTRSYCHGV